MTQLTNCQHHWVIETPHGADSRGVCRKCSEIRYFGNVLEDVVREEYKARVQVGERTLVAV